MKPLEETAPHFVTLIRLFEGAKMGHKIIYGVAVATVGLAIGYFTAKSDSPVVAVVLPFLFSLVAGASSIFVSRADLATISGREHIAFLSVCMITLVASTIAGVEWTLPSRFADPTPDLQTIPGYSELTVEQQVRMNLLRAVAIKMGTSEAEREALLKNAAKSVAIPADDVGAVQQKIAALLPSVEGASVSLVQLPEVADADFRADIANARKVLLASVKLFAEWSKTEVPASVVEEQSRLARFAIEQVVGSGNSLNETRRIALSDQPATLVALVRARAALEANAIRASSTTGGLPTDSLLGPAFASPFDPRGSTLAIVPRRSPLDELEDILGKAS